MHGDAMLFVREDAVEAAWAIVEPILANATTLHPYKPGSWGPHEAARLAMDVGGWHEPGETQGEYRPCSDARVVAMLCTSERGQRPLRRAADFYAHPLSVLFDFRLPVSPSNPQPPLAARPDSPAQSAKLGRRKKAGPPI
jgi:hypothetical protein